MLSMAYKYVCVYRNRCFDWIIRKYKYGYAIGITNHICVYYIKYIYVQLRVFVCRPILYVRQVWVTFCGDSEAH